jgi:GNAT superfamily N-acetyltransferase
VSGPAAVGARVREARAEEAAAVAAAVEKLLLELGGKRPDLAAMEAEVRAEIEDPAAGLVLVAEADGELVGVLGAAYCRAIHVPGRYAVVQDLWVDAAWRSRGVGADLVEALAARGREQGVARLEVGLPKEGFPALAKTEAFYRANGFEHLGPRMRRLLS